MKRNPTRWLDYLASYNSREISVDLIHAEIEKTKFSIAQHYNSFFHNCIPMLYLLDYTSGKYLMTSRLSKSIMGYEQEQFLSEGIGLTIDKYHTDDLKLYNNQMFPDRLKLLRTIPAKDHPDYLFSHNFRLKNKKGHYLNLMQRNVFIKSDDNGNPLLSFGMVINIEHFKSANPVIQTVEKLSTGATDEREVVLKKSYYLKDEDKLFTQREREILLWTAEGLTSKEIANKLYLSEHTVINHRRNMQAKSGCSNITAVVYFAIRQGII